MRLLIISLSALALANVASGQREMENLTRGVVALPAEEGSTFVSWRLFGTDPDSISFNLYRRAAEREPVRVNDEPIAAATNYTVSHHGDLDNARYFVRPIVDGMEGEASGAASVWQEGFLELPIQSIEGYRPGDASVADLDGDGEYDLVLQQTAVARDNSHSGLTTTPVLDAYQLDGTHLWRIDLGHNVRDGEHYTQFIVYDFDGDGRAEVACKTADGTRDGRGNVIGDASKDWRTKDEASPAFGRILDGPEFLTIFDGRSGEALTTVDYLPNRYPVDGWGGRGGNGGNDSYGNRCDRFLACVAYLDGVHPSLIMCRGVYGRTVMVAWDWRGGELNQRWTFDSGISYPPFEDASPFSGMGGHSLSVADVDEDGRDEIVYQAMVVDDDGTGLHATGLRHGDAMHVSDMYPNRPGLEVFTVQENEGKTVRFETPGAAMRDARTGELLWSHSPGVDVRAGLAADIDPRHEGYEAWGGPDGLRNRYGESIGPAPQTLGFALWWDGDLLRELLAGSRVTKWNWEQSTESALTVFGPRGRRGGRFPCLTGDLLGDWREEVILPSPDGRAVRLYTTSIPTEHRIATLMHDPQYRLGVAWQNVAYNKPPHPSFFLGNGMQPPPKPNIRLIGNGEAIRRTPACAPRQ